MFKCIVLPGSRDEEGGTAAVGTLGRFSEDELGALSEVVAWWRNRSALGDSVAPLESHFGGVDAVGRARTVGATTGAVALARPLLPTDTAALLVVALGVNVNAPLSYALAALCHFQRQPDGDWLTDYATLGRSGEHTAEVRTAVELGSGQPVLQMRGIAGATIDWKVEVYRLEL